MRTMDKLKIIPFSDNKFKVPFGVPFVAMFNPETYSVNHSVTYEPDKTAGGVNTKQNFKGYNSRNLTFKLVMDGTGFNGFKIPVIAQVEAFLTLMEFNGDEHQSPFLILNWGTLAVKCVLTSATVNYKLFNNWGAPIRAEVDATFLEQVPYDLRQAISKLSSPDLTHEVIVKAGDTLPLLCNKIYGNPKYYQDVARANGLTNFRSLKEGSVLYFPPLVNETNA